MPTISRAVGKGVSNPNTNDVTLVQRLLNKHRPPPFLQISENGILTSETVAAIEEFQRRVVKMMAPDGRVDPNGATLRKLAAGGGTNGSSLGLPPLGGGSASAAAGSTASGVFSHPDAGKVTLTYGANAVKLNSKAEQLLKSIIAACGMTSANLTSTLRTYHDQARITITQTYKNNPSTVSTWYGADVLAACKKYLNDIDGFAAWWKAHDQKRGRVSSKHLSNRAMDVVPGGDRTKFVAKVKELVVIATKSGVTRIIPKGVMNEPVDHVEFGFDVT